MRGKLIIPAGTPIRTATAKVVNITYDPTDPSKFIRSEDEVASTFNLHNNWSETDAYEFNVTLSFEVEPLVYGLFVNAYGGQNDDYFYSLDINGDNVFVAGETNSFGAGGVDGLVLGINQDGSVAWGKTIGTDNDDHLYSVHVSDGLVLLGYSDAFSSDSYDNPIMAKLDYDGNVGWVKRYAVQNNFTVYDSEAWHNTVLAIGQYSDNSGSFSDMGVLVIGKDGSLVKGVTIGAQNKYTYGRSVSALKNGMYAFVGDTNATSNNRDLLVVVTTPSGEVVSITSYPRNASTFGMTANQVGGDLYIGGLTMDGSATYPYILILDTSGSVKGGYLFKDNSLSGGKVASIAPADDGALVCIDNSINDGSLILIKMDGNLEVEWSYKYPVKSTGANIKVLVKDKLIYLVGPTSVGSNNVDALLAILGEGGTTYLNTVTYQEYYPIIVGLNDFTASDASSAVSATDITGDISVGDITGSVTVKDVTEDINVTKL